MNIHLSFDEKFFYKLKEHKSKIQRELNQNITWEQYFKILFGMK